MDGNPGYNIILYDMHIPGTNDKYHIGVKLQLLVPNFHFCMIIRGGSKKSKLGFEISTQCFPILLYLDRHHAKFQGPRCLGSAPYLTFFFTKEFAQKYIAKIDISVFCIFCLIFYDSKGSLPYRSICLIHTVLLIPILAYFMTFYVINCH